MWFENGKYYFLNTKTLLFVFHFFLRIKIYYCKLFRRVSPAAANANGNNMRDFSLPNGEEEKNERG